MDHTLTRDAKKALATIYKAYKSRRASGEAKSSAVYFDTESHDATAIDAAVSDSLAELSNAKYIKTDICGNYTLTVSGIIFMENLPIDTIKAQQRSKSASFPARNRSRSMPVMLSSATPSFTSRRMPPTPTPIITPSSSTALCLPLLAIIIFAAWYMFSPPIE